MVTQRIYFSSKQAVYDYADTLAAIMHSWEMITDYGYDSDNPREPFYIETKSNHDMPPFVMRDRGEV